MPYTITDDCTGCAACVRVCPTQAISGQNKELHRIDEDLCIECGACGRICPGSAVKNQFGNLCIMIKRSQWKRPVVDSNSCMSCSICIDACPTHCLAMSDARGPKDPHGSPFLKDEKACIGCGFCESECPVAAITMVVPAPRKEAAPARPAKKAVP